MYLHVLCNTQIYFFTSFRHNGNKHFGRGAKISWPRVEHKYKISISMVNFPILYKLSLNILSGKKLTIYD